MTNTISTYPELSAELDRRDGVMTVEMALLRDIQGPESWALTSWQTSAKLWIIYASATGLSNYR